MEKIGIKVSFHLLLKIFSFKIQHQLKKKKEEKTMISCYITILNKNKVINDF